MGGYIQITRGASSYKRVQNSSRLIINDSIIDEQTADDLTRELEKTEEQWEELELLADDFVGDIRLGQQLKFIKDNIQAYKDKLAQAIADRG